ncbi:MAG: peptidoglycan-associated lipoprotein Pal [Rhodoferax sp.]|nr:peptidoglycan-associated lipoprotein Pal [Rhodoferax sp.]
MKTTRCLALIASTATVFFAGCSSTPIAPATPAPAPVAAQAPTPAPAPKPAESTVAKVVVAPHLDANSLISKERSVYFDYDVFTIKQDYAALVERQGKYLASNAGLQMKVEGNADERGSSEYNLALGQKRAEAVARALKVYGVKDAQVEAVSWGKEKPKNTAHTEAAWAENRRADLVYPQR